MTETEANAIAYLESCGVIPSASPVFSLGAANSQTGTTLFLERLAAPEPETWLSKLFRLIPDNIDRAERPSIFRR